MKVSENFSIEEFVDKDTYRKFGDKSVWFIDKNLIQIAQELRNHFGPITINNYFSGGNRNWSGLRTMKSSYYSPYSQHSFGRAIDMIFENHDAEYIRNEIRNNEKYWFDYGVRAIENNVSWLHIDVRNTNKFEIKWFNA